MELTDEAFDKASIEMTTLREQGHATEARYDRKANRLIVSLHNGIELAVPVHLIQGLAHAGHDELSTVEVTPSGLGLHWPDLDTDVYVPALLSGVFGTRSWMASVMGAEGGKASSAAKVAASRDNGRKGGRPRKIKA